MDEARLKPDEDPVSSPETPEETSVHDGKYHDFSSSRREFRAQRHVETTAELKRAVEQAQIEMEQARQLAEEQAARYAEVYKRWRESQGYTEETVQERISSESDIAVSHGSRRSDAETDNFSRRASDRRADRQDGDTDEQRSQTVDLRRRRELATDLSTRTERRPRSPEQFAQTSEHSRADTEARGEDMSRNGRDDYAENDRKNVLDGDISPEWLLRNRRTEEDAIREQLQADAQEIALEMQQRLKDQ